MTRGNKLISSKGHDPLICRLPAHGPFDKRLWTRNWNFVKSLSALIMIIMIQADLHYSDAIMSAMASQIIQFTYDLFNKPINRLSNRSQTFVSSSLLITTLHTITSMCQFKYCYTLSHCLNQHWLQGLLSMRLSTKSSSDIYFRVCDH